MSTQTVCAPRRAIATSGSRAERLERRLQSFRPEVLQMVRNVAARHPWIADLSVSFPALLFALAVPRAGGRSEAGLRLVTSGAPLSAAAAAAEIPLWLRAFPPEAFVRPIPELPDSASFRRRISNHWPKVWRDAPNWLDRVAHAATWADDDIAVWIAREVPLARKRKKRFRRDLSRLICLWAWFSGRAESKAGALIATRWNADMRWSAATLAVYEWTDALSLALSLGDRGIEDAWLEPGAVDGYSFTPLATYSDIVAEAKAMHNCVRSYGRDLATNYNRLWSVRRGGERIATLSLSSAQIGAPFPHISELSGVRNAEVGPEVWLAARRWLHAQDVLPVAPRRLEAQPSVTFHADLWRSTWRTYWLAKARIPTWLPLTPSANSLYSI